MRVDFDTKIYDSFEELLDPSHTAVIVVDMQNDLVSREGFLDKVGEDVSANRHIIEPIRTVINGARQAGMLIVYIQYTMDTGHALATPAWVHQGGVLEYMGERKRSYRVDMEGCFEGTWGWEVIPELAPEPGDVCVRKNNMGGFWGTNLDKVLRGQRHRHSGDHRHRHPRLRAGHCRRRRGQRLLHRLRPGLRGDQRPQGTRARHGLSGAALPGAVRRGARHVLGLGGEAGGSVEKRPKETTARRSP